MRKQGSERWQLSSQLMPLLKERMLGVKGEWEMSWSLHWPNWVNIPEYFVSLTTPSFVVARMRLDTSLT